VLTRIRKWRAISNVAIASVILVIGIAAATGVYVEYTSATTLTVTARIPYTLTKLQNVTATSTTTTTVYSPPTAILSTSSQVPTSYPVPLPLNPPNSSTVAVTVNWNSSLNLILMINASVIESGQSVNLTYYFANHTDENITLNSIWKFAAPGLNDTPCGTFVAPAVYRGVYSSVNVSQATPLPLWPPNEGVSCPIGEHGPSYTFLANSEYLPNGPAWASLSNSGYLIPEENCPYYNGTTILDTEPTCWINQSFQKGTYTLAVGDEWSDLVLLYLNVL
jgi:hypothetical protein